MKIYLASPFFNEEQIKLRDEVLKFLEEFNLDVFSPEHHAVKKMGLLEKVDYKFANGDIREKIREIDLKELVSSDIVLALVNYVDAGTAYERGFAFAKKIPSIDFFKDKHDSDFYNLMYSDCNASFSNYKDLKDGILTFKELWIKFKGDNENFRTFFDYLKAKLGNKLKKILTTLPVNEKCGC
ncbi:nucleoside 2-deoxyribosyltransferase [Borreliella yangtzensis]|uniref:nucleoside 2-deoxyribosyltransferase n=1 Tax=Borreliella yangtzensis TaxID=683292 RepID=UPI002648D6D4|nr:nucleoside 2-deoxyribosyltransferase [Borreliella yangtzensis]WKC75231.1 nucleoside 2-deoxyribosyltransferase [Borreliella yangtzensis]